MVLEQKYLMKFILITQKLAKSEIPENRDITKVRLRDLT